MTGVVYVEREDGGAVVSLRDGAPVFIEDLGGGDPLGDALLAQEVITPDEYTKIMEHSLSDLTGSEDLAFARKAVELGVLSQAQVDAELQRRVRGQMIQALAWDSARIEIDEDPDALTCPEYAQSLGSLLYMAVRTFFDEERVQQLLGDHRELYLRLLRARAEVADDLGLDDAERELLGAFGPPSSVRTAAERLAADSLEAHQLAAMLVLAEHAEHASRPWSAPIEVPSQQRGTRNPSALGRYVTTEAIPEERLGPVVRPRPVTPARITRPVTQPVTQPVTPPVTTDDYAFSAPAAPTAPPARPPSAPQPRVATSSGSPSASRAQPPVEPAPAPEPRQPVERRPDAARPRRLGAALKRLGKELEERRAQTQGLVPESESPTGAAARPAPSAVTPSGPSAATSAAAAASAAAAPGASAARELIRRRRAMVSQQERATGDKKPQGIGAAELMRSAQDALRDQQFGRAQELLARACDAEPGNDVYKMYRLWAAFRASTIQEADLTALKAIVREKLNDELLKGFAYYAMGHIMLADKKDDHAEKFFRKAMEVDKTNKDAERHVRLLQLRNKSATTETANNKIFGIEIGKKS
jgi:hypothetical protein